MKLGQQFVFVVCLLLMDFVVLAAADPLCDPAGVERLHPTAQSGREWFCNWERSRTVDKRKVDPDDALCKNSADVPLTIGKGVASWPAGVTRLYITTPDDQVPWRNVEMTIYVRRGPSPKNLASEAIDLSARSGMEHNDRNRCDGTSYHASARLDGKCGFKKEVWHTGGYTNLQPTPAPKPWAEFPEGQWVGMKFVCRNFDANEKVRLEMFLDRPEKPGSKDHATWEPVSQFDDGGNWYGQDEGCGRPRNYILTGGYPVVYFRTDRTPVEMKCFSVREIDPLP